MRLRFFLRKILVVFGGVTLASAALSLAVRSGFAADSENYDVVIANGRAARAPIS
jgi:hypothetical protein